MFDTFAVYPSRRLLENDSDRIRVGSRSFDLLVALLENAGSVLERDQLHRLVWPETRVADGSLRVLIAGLRKLLGGNAGRDYIAWVPGEGYRFDAEVRKLVDVIASPPAHRPTPLPLTLVPAIVGRELTLELLGQRIRDQRLVSVVGSGGVGKTALAIEAANAAQDSFDGGVSFIDLSLLGVGSLVEPFVATQLGAEGFDAVETASSVFDRGRSLIVFDNCEHVVAGVRILVTRLLDRLPNLQVLATSREILACDGESVFRLSPLQTPDRDATVTAADVINYAGIRLFVERAVASTGDFTLTDENAPFVAMVCWHLRGLPLAIELATSRLEEFGVRGLAERLDNCLSLLSRGKRTSPSRHQTIRASLEWSYRLLPPAEAETLRRLSVLAPPFSTSMVDEVVGGMQGGPANGLIQGLVEKSVLFPEKGAQEFQMCVLMREFALSQVTATRENLVSPLQHRRASA